MDGRLFHVSLVLLQKSQVKIGFRVVGIRPERTSKTSDRLLCLLFIGRIFAPARSVRAQNPPESTTRANNNPPPLNSSLNNQQVADVIILRGSLRQELTDALGFDGGLRQVPLRSQKLRKILVQKIVSGGQGERLLVELPRLPGSSEAALEASSAIFSRTA